VQAGNDTGWQDCCLATHVDVLTAWDRATEAILSMGEMEVNKEVNCSCQHVRYVRGGLSCDREVATR
jgi:hypothetical protein